MLIADEAGHELGRPESLTKFKKAISELRFMYATDKEPGPPLRISYPCLINTEKNLRPITCSTLMTLRLKH
jgi:hypothetical protein